MTGIKAMDTHKKNPLKVCDFEGKLEDRPVNIAGDERATIWYGMNK